METLKTNRSWAIASLLGLALLTACSSTKVTNVWTDPEVRKPKYRQLMVVGVDERAVVRRDFEDEFVARLTMQRVLGLPSYRHFSLVELYENQAAVQAKLAELQVDGLLLARVLDRETVEKYYQPEQPSADPRAFRFDPAVPYRTWHDYYQLGYVENQRLQPKIVVERVRLEANLYDVATGEIRWSALSETYLDNMADHRQNVRSVVSAMLKSLERKGMVR